MRSRVRPNGLGCYLVSLLCVLAMAGCRQRESGCGEDGCGDGSGNTGGSGGEVDSGGPSGDIDGVDRGGAGGGDVDEVDSGGSGGSAGENASGAVGGGGMPGGAVDGGRAGAENEAGARGSPEPECTEDADCAAAFGCFGPEHCAEGKCQAPTTQECGPELVCVEHGPGTSTCDYPNPGQWLLFTGNHTGRIPPELRALRLEGATVRPSISISEGVGRQIILGYGWSPDGRHAIASTTDYANAETWNVFHVQFGEGLPSTPAPLPGIPAAARAYPGAWALDGSALLFFNDTLTRYETYLVHVEHEGLRTELLFNEEQPTSDAEFCANARWFYRSVDGAVSLVDSQHPEEARFLWSGTVSLSPDGRNLLGSNDATGMSWSTCGPDAEVVHLTDEPAWDPWSDGFDWSDDGRFVAVLRDSGNEIMVLDSEAEFQSVFRAPHDPSDITLEHQWVPKSSRLIVLGPRGAGEQTIDEVDLSTAPATVISRGSLFEVASWDVLNDGTLWAIREELAPLARDVWVLENGTTDWRALGTAGPIGWKPFSADQNFVIVIEELDDETLEIAALPVHQGTTAIRRALAEVPAGSEWVGAFAGGVLITNSFGATDELKGGQIWWLSFGPSGFGPEVLLSDVRYAEDPDPQPEPR